jgi:hypothetical protein
VEAEEVGLLAQGDGVSADLKQKSKQGTNRRKPKQATHREHKNKIKAENTRRKPKQRTHEGEHNSEPTEQTTTDSQQSHNNKYHNRVKASCEKICGRRLA